MGVAPSEIAETQKRFEAKKLLKLIFEDLNPEDFTLDEIKHEFNDKARKFQEFHLENLAEDDFIVESGEKGHYHITSKAQLFYEKS